MKKIFPSFLAFSLTVFLVCVFVINTYAAEYSIKIEKDTYLAGEDITVTYTGSAHPNDWIGICYADVPQYEGNTIGVWVYCNSDSQTAGTDVVENGTVHFPGNQFKLEPGEYAMYMMIEDGYLQVADAYFKVVEKLEEVPAENSAAEEAPAENSVIEEVSDENAELPENPETTDNTYDFILIALSIFVFCIVTLKQKELN